MKPSPLTTRAFYNNADISRAPGVLKLANDENILRIAEEYFGAIPKIDSIWACGHFLMIIYLLHNPFTEIWTL